MPATDAHRRRPLARGGMLAAVVALALSAGAAAAGPLPDRPAVTTLAGSGAPGIADGPAATATFLGPQGLAYDAKGDLYVADTPAQRIRMIDRRGIVTTVAGSGVLTLFGAGVGGGYRNGPALQARFNEPTGVAVAPDGTVYVADLRNRCIRAIHDGIVTTVAGSPQRVGGADGALAQASFTNPRSIAVDGQGTLWVADPPDGVRRIAHGVVSTLPVAAFDRARAVAVYGGTLYVATPRVVWAYDIARRKIVDGIATLLRERYPPLANPVEMKLIGPAVAVAGIAPSQFVYADDLYSTVTLVQYRKARTIGAPPLLDAGAIGGGFRSGVDARFAQPMGIALAPSGAIAVADTGNRRIRLIGPFDRTSYEADVHLPTAPNPHVYRIAIVGDSYVWDGVSAQESLGGVVRARLCARLARHPCNVEVIPVRFDGALFTDTASEVDQFLSDGLVNEVVLMATSFSFAPRDGDPARRIAAMAATLRALRAKTRASHTRLVVALFPDAFDMPDETTFGKLVNGPNYDPGTALRHYRATLAQVRSSGVDAIDLWPAFFANDARPEYRTLFGAFDDHFTVHGNALFGDAVAADAIRHGFGARP